jgi:hypothetical protein
VGFPRHKELRNGGIADDNGAGGFQSGNERRIGRSDVSLPQTSAGLTEQAGDIERTLDRDRHAMQRTYRRSTSESFIRNAGLLSGPLFVDAYKRAEFGLEAPNQSENVIDHFLR